MGLELGVHLSPVRFGALYVFQLPILIAGARAELNALSTDAGFAQIGRSHAMRTLDPSLQQFLRSQNIGTNSDAARALVASGVNSMELLLGCKESELRDFGFAHGQIVAVRLKKQEMTAASPASPERDGPSSPRAASPRPASPRAASPRAASPGPATPLLRLAKLNTLQAYQSPAMQRRAVLLERAMASVDGGKSIRAAAQDLGLSFTTLHAHVKGLRARTGAGTPSKLTREQERLIVDWADTASSMGWEVTRRLIAERARELCPDVKCTSHWWKGFMRRNPDLSKKKTNVMEAPRASALNAPNIVKWTELLKKTVEELNVSASSIFNMDETGFSFDMVRRAPVLLCKLCNDTYVCLLYEYICVPTER